MLQFQLGCYSPGWETQSSMEAENALCGDRGEADLHREKSPPWSLIDLFLCRWGLQILTIWLVQIVPSWLVRMQQLCFVGDDANEDITVQFQLDREHLSPIGWILIPRALLIRVDFQTAEAQCRRVGSPVFGFSLKCSVHDRPLQTMAARLWLWIWAQLTTRSLFWQVYSSQSTQLYSNLTQIYIQRLSLLVPQSSFLPAYSIKLIFLFGH